MNTLTNFRQTIRLAAWLAAGVMCAVPAPARGQGQPTPPPPQAASTAEQQPVVMIKKESKLVLVDSVVTDKKGNYIRDLTKIISRYLRTTRNNKFPPFLPAPMQPARRTANAGT